MFDSRKKPLNIIGIKSIGTPNGNNFDQVKTSLVSSFTFLDYDIDDLYFCVINPPVALSTYRFSVAPIFTS